MLGVKHIYFNGTNPIDIDSFGRRIRKCKCQEKHDGDDLVTAFHIVRGKLDFICLPEFRERFLAHLFSPMPTGSQILLPKDLLMTSFRSRKSKLKPMRTLRDVFEFKKVGHRPAQYVKSKFRAANWNKTFLEYQSWNKYKENMRDRIKKFKHFRIMAFDFETRPSDSTPVIVCMTEEKRDGSLELVAEFVGPQCHIEYLKFLFDMILKADPFTKIVVLGFNSSRFDNIFITSAMRHVQDPRLKYRYVESNGRIIELTLQVADQREVTLRDVLMYFPVGSRGSLRNMAITLKLDMQKNDCSLEEMQYVGDLIVGGGGGGLLTKGGFENDATFLREIEYCRQDTRVLYGLAKYIGTVFSAMPGPTNYYLKANWSVIPSVYCYLVWFITLPQLAFSFLPWVLDDVPIETFSSLVDLVPARFIKCSIYGGRTLCASVGQIIRGVTSTDICSEYPAAMNGPMPSGRPFYCGLSKINELNRLLANDKLFADNFAFCQVFPPFIAHVRIFKEREFSVHNPSTGFHSSEQTLPFIPYKHMPDEFIANPISKKCGALEWLADTNGKELFGIYNCIDIYHMRRMGFSVHITTVYRTICWPQWSTILGKLFSHLYIEKARAKKAGNAELELLIKIVINSSIGKFAQRMTEKVDFDGVTYTKTGKVGRNKIMYQLNSFCMAWSRIINQSHQSLICKGTHIPDFLWTTDDSCFINQPLYGDTDNLIFRALNVDAIKAAMTSYSLFPSEVLCSFNMTGTYFNMTLEFESWHKCPSGISPCIANVVFLGKKSYIMQCASCNAFRLKAKGHSKSGIKVEDYAKLFHDPLYTENYFLQDGDDLGAIETSRRLLQAVYPHLTQDEAYKLTSGKRFSMKITLPKTGRISITPTFIERTYRASISPNQVRCTKLDCLRIIHV